MNYIAPEHIAAAAAELDDVTMVAFFEAVGVDREVLKTEARRRLKGERERERARPQGRRGGRGNSARSRRLRRSDAAGEGIPSE